MARYRPPRPTGSKYITPEGAAALREELDYLWKTKRPAVTAAVAEAAALGDRSENAEYIYGKRQLAEIDRRIRYLRKRLDGMVVVDQLPSDRTRVFFGAWFELEREDGQVARHRLVGPDEIGAQEEYISMDSPLGRAVLGKRVNDTIQVRVPDGERTFRIAAVHYVERNK
ncbi:MAG TPA: transcription elongation factor GreB [Gammaproteobacteria bacterium]